MEDCETGISKIEEITCIITFKILISIRLKKIYIKRVVVPIQGCQVSWFGRDTHGYSPLLTVSRQELLFS